MHVRAVFADPNRHLRNGNEYKSMNTSGSAFVRRQHPQIMQTGASARERLKEAAAARVSAGSWVRTGH
jgi:isoquinoline 1-oxidoreductase beta subunit